jgi:hypothetical protein
MQIRKITQIISEHGLYALDGIFIRGKKRGLHFILNPVVHQKFPLALTGTHQRRTENFLVFKGGINITSQLLRSALGVQVLLIKVTMVFGNTDIA